MNEFFKPQNPEDDELITESAGNPKEEALPLNSIDGQGDPNSQDSLVDKANQKTDEQDESNSQELPETEIDTVDELNELFRQFLDSRDGGDQRLTRKLLNRIYNILSKSLRPDVVRASKDGSYRGDAWIKTWIQMQNNYDPNQPTANLIHYFHKVYHFRLKDAKLAAQNIERRQFRNPQANDDTKQPKTRSEYKYNRSLNKSRNDDEGNENQSLLDYVVKDIHGNPTIYRKGENPPKPFYDKDLMAWIKTRPKILQQTPCLPNIPNSPTALDLGFVLVELDKEGVKFTLTEVEKRLGVSNQIRTFFKGKFSRIIRKHFVNWYNNGEE